MHAVPAPDGSLVGPLAPATFAVVGDAPKPASCKLEELERDAEHATHETMQAVTISHFIDTLDSSR